MYIKCHGAMINMSRLKSFVLVLLVTLAFVGSASAVIDTANITDAIDLIGTVGSSFIGALSTIFVDNLGTILTLVAVGVVILVFGGFGKMIVSFMMGIFGNMTNNIKKQ